jgi:CMP-N-acetylneuraminic acid synthetase
MTLALFLPCRAGSERVPDKNTRPFAGREGGLLALKLDTLEQVGALDEIVLDSNDPKVLALGEARQRTWTGRARLTVRARPDALGQSSTTTDSLIRYALDTVSCTDLAWTHVTSPLVPAVVHDEAFARYAARGMRYDSLMAVTALRTFLWHEVDGEPAPMNHERSPLRWPRTQDLRACYEVNSALFVVPREVGRARADRIGERPILFELDRLIATDVDWEEDFALAETLYRMRAGRTG